MSNSPFKWVGGKTQLLSELEPLIPAAFNRYFEPFCGGGALFFDLVGKKRIRVAHLSDTNEELIGTYRIIRNQIEDLIAALQSPPFTDTSKEDYLYIRESPEGSEVYRAARFIYLNRLGYNGLYRVNKKGRFNVPYGSYANPTVCQEDKLRRASQLLQTDVSLNCASYVSETLQCEAGDFVYFDPPYYPVSETAKFTSFTSNGFDHADHVQLAHICALLRSKGVHVMVSNSDVPVIRELFGDFHLHQVMARRSVNSVGSKRGRVPELIIRSYE